LKVFSNNIGVYQVQNKKDEGKECEEKEKKRKEKR
jgi:hypothetical protein